MTTPVSCLTPDLRLLATFGPGDARPVRRCCLCEGPLDSRNEVAADGPWHVCCERAVSRHEGLTPLTEDEPVTQEDF